MPEATKGCRELIKFMCKKRCAGNSKCYVANYVFVQDNASKKNRLGTSKTPQAGDKRPSSRKYRESGITWWPGGGTRGGPCDRSMLMA